MTHAHRNGMSHDPSPCNVASPWRAALPAAVHRFVNNAGIGFDKLTGFPDCRSVVVVVEEAEKQVAEVDTWAAHSAHPLNPFCFLLVRISSRVCQGPMPLSSGCHLGVAPDDNR